MQKIKADGLLPAKKRNTLSAILFIPAFIIFIFIFKLIADWRNDLIYEQDQLAQNRFVIDNYEPLLLSQIKIKNEKIRMQRILQEVADMGQEHSNHQKLIFNVVNKWGVGLQELWNTYTDTSKQIRYYWLLSKTNEGHNVRETFSNGAIELEKNNNKAEKKYQKIIYSIKDDLIKSIDNARKLLASTRRPSKNKKRKLKNQLLRESIQPFKDATVSKLVNFVGTIDGRLKERIEKLQDLIRVSGQQSILIRNYLHNNPDLEIPLTITINNWIVLENNSRDKLNQILYAIEAEYIAQRLDLSSRDPSIRGMHKSLKNNIPQIVGKALKQKKNIDQSYNISPRKKK